MNPAVGIVCSLTDEKPQFEEKCEDFLIDEQERDRLDTLEQEASDYEEANGGGFFAPEQRGIQKGVTGGVAMIAIAVAWFFIGLQMGYVYYYPPILFCIGLYALIKGIVKGNLSGKKN